MYCYRKRFSGYFVHLRLEMDTCTWVVLKLFEGAGCLIQTSPDHALLKGLRWLSITPRTMCKVLTMACEAWQNPTSCCSSNLIFSHFLLTHPNILASLLVTECGQGCSCRRAFARLPSVGDALLIFMGLALLLHLSLLSKCYLFWEAFYFCISIFSHHSLSPFSTFFFFIVPNIIYLLICAFTFVFSKVITMKCLVHHGIPSAWNSTAHKSAPTCLPHEQMNITTLSIKNGAIPS